MKDVFSFSKVWLTTATTLLLAFIPSPTFSLQYDFSVIFNDQSPRDLQTSVGTVPNFGPPINNCAALSGAQFYCELYQIVGTTEAFMELNTSVTCTLDATVGFDFRLSTDCSCDTLLTPSNKTRLPKNCPCLVCPQGFGPSSVSIDCTNATNSNTTSLAPSTEMPDPYIYQTCVSVDCGANCNGSCTVGCDDPIAATKCGFCTTVPTSTPTLAPTNTLAPSNIPTLRSSTEAPTGILNNGTRPPILTGNTSDTTPTSKALHFVVWTAIVLLLIL